MPLYLHVLYLYVVPVHMCVSQHVYMGVCILLPGNQILISEYLAIRGVVVSGGWSNGSGWQQNTKWSSAPSVWDYNYFVVCCHPDPLLHPPDTTTSLLARYLLIKIWLPGNRLRLLHVFACNACMYASSSVCRCMEYSILK